MINKLLLLLPILFLSCTVLKENEVVEKSGWKYTDVMFVPGTNDLLVIKNEYIVNEYSYGGIETLSEKWTIQCIKENGDTVVTNLLEDTDYHSFSFVSSNPKTVFLYDAKKSRSELIRFTYQSEQLEPVSVDDYVSSLYYYTIQENDSLIYILSEETLYKIDKESKAIVNQLQYNLFSYLFLPFYMNLDSDTLYLLEAKDGLLLKLNSDNLNVSNIADLKQAEVFQYDTSYIEDSYYRKDPNISPQFAVLDSGELLFGCNYYDYDMYSYYSGYSYEYGALKVTLLDTLVNHSSLKETIAFSSQFMYGYRASDERCNSDGTRYVTIIADTLLSAWEMSYE